jgi:hypothetical protein
MLARNSYPKAYITACRARVDAQVEDFRKLAAAKQNLEPKSPAFEKAFETVEVAFFNNLAIVLEGYFVHRTRALEKNDGNPLNEVRVIANSLMTNDEMMGSDNTIKLIPEKSVLKYELGDPIRLNEADFTQLANAFFTDLEAKFSDR